MVIEGTTVKKSCDRVVQGALGHLTTLATFYRQLASTAKHVKVNYKPTITTLDRQ